MADPVPVDYDPFAVGAPQPIEGNPFDPIEHGSMYDRMMHGTAVGRVLSKGVSSAKEGFGDGGFGFQPGSEMSQLMQNIGVFNDPERSHLVDPIRAVAEAAVKVPTAAADLGLRSIQAGVYGVSGALAQSMGEFTGASDSHIEVGKNEIAMMINLALMKDGMGGPAPLSRIRRGPDGVVRQEAVGSLPKEADFAVATEAVKLAEPEAKAPVVEDKVRALYEQYGVHPAELMADAREDPALAKDLASDSPMLPARYTDLDPAAMKADQIAKEAAASEKKPAEIPGVSPELNSALKVQLTWPETPLIRDADAGGAHATPSMRFGDFVSRTLDRVGMGVPSIVRDLQMKFTPMAERGASMDARASAKDFANTMRLARYDGQLLHGLLTKEFPPERLTAMWDAADARSVALQKGEVDPGLPGLSTAERGVVTALQRRATEAWEDARSAGIVKKDAQALPSYVPRMVVAAMGEASEGLALPLNTLGQNLRTRTAQLMRRTYLTAEETEAAAQKKLGEDATLVRDIRTLNLATARLNEAVAGRQLINQIRELGSHTELPTVVEGVPEGPAKEWFTLDHPAFKRWQPLMGRDAAGKFMRAQLPDGTPAFEKVPLYVSKEFEGPLRSVLTEPEGAAYRALMEMKAKAMSLIMISPLLHNAVIFGRAMPAQGGNPIAVVRLYFDGNKVKSDPLIMREAIQNGFVPIGRHGAQLDITSVTGEMNIEPGRSITAKLAASIPGLFDKGAGTAVKAAVDKAGDFWHNTLLWERVGDLQAGLYKHFRDDLVSKGFETDTAAKEAAHLANRYAGMLSPEAMSPMARKMANVMLFSRSYTLGNVGAMKDMLVGMPRDMLAQIERDGGLKELADIRSYGQRKAVGIVAVDMALFYAGNSILQSTLQVLRGDNTLSEEGKGYVERFGQALKRVGANPYEAMNPFAFLTSLSSTGGNEPAKQDKILVGYQSDGTALYARNPTGKTGEEMVGWLTQPAQMVKNKLSTIIKPGYEVFNNKDFRDKHIYNPYPNTPEKVISNIAAIAFHFMKAQVPTDMISAAYDLVRGTPTADEAKIDTLKLVGPLIGLMFSQGFPGGPAGGELMRGKEEQKFAQDQVMGDIRKAIKEDRIDEAREKMEGVHIPPKLQNFLIETTRNPSASFARRRMQELLRSLPEDQQERVRDQLSRSKAQ